MARVAHCVAHCVAHRVAHCVGRRACTGLSLRRESRMIGSILELMVDLLAQLWNGLRRSHRSGFGASPREQADFRRHRWILGVLVGLCLVTMFALWWIARG